MRKILCVIVPIVVSKGLVFADSPELPVPLVGGFHNMYSPFQVEDRIWLGGWFDEPEQVPWPDKIYVSQRNTDGSWTIPIPIRWADSQSYPEAGALARISHHIRVPSLVP